MPENIFYKFIGIKEIDRQKIADGIIEALKIMNIKQKVDLMSLVNIVHEKEKLEQQLPLNILFQNSFHFSYPREFNDPYDSHVFCRYEGTKEEWETYFTQNPNDELRSAIRGVNYDPDTIDEILRHVNSEFHDTDIACCFTRKRNNILLWSHYASNHKGICLGFKSTIINGEHYFEMDEQTHFGENPYFALLKEIEYVKARPNKINPVKKAYYNIEKFHITKRNTWKYEKEYRMLIKASLFNDAKNHYSKLNYKYKKRILKEVIFGVNTDTELQENIIAFVRENYISEGIPVKIYKAVKRKYSYGLDFIRIEKYSPTLRRWNYFP